MKGIISDDADPIEAAYAVFGTVLPTFDKQCTVAAQIMPSAASGRRGRSKSGRWGPAAPRPPPIKVRLVEGALVQGIASAKRELDYFYTSDTCGLLSGGTCLSLVQTKSYINEVINPDSY